MIRHRRPTDLPACVAALAEVHARDAYPVRWPADPSRWLTPRALHTAWVAEAEGRVAGHVGLCRPAGDACVRLWSARTGRPAAEAGVLSRLFVSPAAHGLGLGLTLLDHAAAQARALGLVPMLEVLALNEHAVRLYDRAGWQRLGTVDYQLYDELVPMHCYTAPETSPESLPANAS